MERLQPGCAFPNAAALALANRIVAALGGFTLALRRRGLFLARFPADGQALLEEMATEGLEGFERITENAERGLFLHDEKKLTVTLRPIFNRLLPDEWMTLQFAALMPAGTVVWAWMESLVGDRFPAVEMAERPSEISRWTAIRGRLQSLRLIFPSAETCAGRMHGLVHEAVSIHYGFAGSALRKLLIELTFRKCSALEHAWNNREGDRQLTALQRWAVHLSKIDKLAGGTLEERIANLLRSHGRYREEEPLRRHVLGVRQHVLGPERSETISAIHDLGVNCYHLGRSQ